MTRLKLDAFAIVGIVLTVDIFAMYACYVYCMYLRK